jgi:hypothetical protein
MNRRRPAWASQPIGTRGQSVMPTMKPAMRRHVRAATPADATVVGITEQESA